MIARRMMGAAGGAAAPALLLDTYPALAGYSPRKLRAAQALCLRLRRDSDDAEMDFGFSGNDLDTASIATWLGGANGFLATWYDQSGNGNDWPEAGSQFAYSTTGGPGSKPTIHKPGTERMVLPGVFGSNPLGTQPFTLFCLYKTTNSSSAQFPFGLGDPAGNDVVCQATDPSLRFKGASIGGFVDPQPTDFFVSVIKKSSSNVYTAYFNEVQQASGSTAQAIDDSIAIGRLSTIAVDEYYEEYLIFDSALNDTDRTGVFADMDTYWGLT